MSLLGVDIGHSGCKVIIFNNSGNILSHEYLEHSLIFPREGWVELDSDLIFNNIKVLIKKASQKIKKDRIKALSISCQGETFTPVDKTKSNLSNSIVSLDNRAKNYYAFWDNTLGKKKIYEITGMPLHQMYTINKIMWIKDNRKDIHKKVYKFLCLEDYIFMKLGFGPTIDYSLAARTMAFDINNNNWSKTILGYAGIDIDLLPEVKPSGSVIGELSTKVKNELELEGSVFAVTGGHDQACGAFGSGIIGEGTAMNATGTSDVLMTIFKKPYLKEIMFRNNCPCAPYVLSGKYTVHTFNFTGGLLLKWYRDNFFSEPNKILKNKDTDVYKMIDKSIYSKPVNVFILPHLAGSGTPALDPNSKGIIMGIDLETDKSKLSRAILESSAYDLKLNLEILESTGTKISNIIAIGGGAKSPVWLQIKANILGKKIMTLKNTEAASFGAALLAGIAIGEFKSYKHAIENTIYCNQIFEPDGIDYAEYNKRYEIYKDIYSNNVDLLHRISKL